MGKNSKIIGIGFLVLGVLCILMYFILGDKYSNHTVNFDTSGGTVILAQTVKKGEKAAKPVDPTKENSDFVEWQLDGVTYDFNSVVSKNITLKAVWRDYNVFNVIMTLEGEKYTGTVREGELLVLEKFQMPAKEGYNIKLYTADDKEYELTTPVSGDLTLTAKYVEIKTYTVKFDSNGGTKVDNAKVVEGEVVLEPKPTRDGYILDGWYLGEEKFDFQTKITKDITLKARWNDGPKVNVIFMVDGKVYKTVPTKENTTVTKPSNPTRDGYKFKEWQLDGKTFDFKTKITTEITLSAVFDEAYKVKFNSDGGSSVKEQLVVKGGKATKPSDPTKKDFKFKEWQLDGKTFDFKTTITKDITLKAIWEAAVVKYTVKFNDYDGKEITTQSVESGKKATKPADPTRENYTFAYWLYNNREFNFDTEITSNIVLTAYYDKNPTTPDIISGDMEG